MKSWTWAASPIALALVLMLGGCASSAPLRFYTLSEMPAEQNAARASDTAHVIRVARVKIPGELDRAELVQRIDANRLRIAEQDRWAAPLDDMIRRVLSADLQARPAQEDATLSVDIQEFTGDTACGVTLRASWELKPASAADSGIRSGQELIRVPSAPTACSIQALPAAMSRALAQLSERILASGG